MSEADSTRAQFVKVPDELKPSPVDLLGEIVARFRGTRSFQYLTKDELDAIEFAVSELDRYKRIVRSVLRNLEMMSGNSGDDPSPLSGVLWRKVAHFCGLGSTLAHLLCREFDCDPESIASNEK